MLLEGGVRVTRVLHEVRVWAGMEPGGFVVVSGCGRVKIRADEGLGQPRQVMAAGTHGPSGQQIFDM